MGGQTKVDLFSALRPLIGNEILCRSYRSELLNRVMRRLNFVRIRTCVCGQTRTTIGNDGSLLTDKKSNRIAISHSVHDVPIEQHRDIYLLDQ
eukprot:scaffold894_cov153-Cylindrotheca_fusiformis.AAC.3